MAGDTYCDLEDCFVDSARKSRDGICPNHISHGIHLGLPDCSGKHHQGCDNVDWPSADAESDGDKNDAADGQRCHIRGIAVVQDGGTHTKLGVEVLPERNRNAKTGGSASVVGGERRADEYSHGEDHQSIEAKNGHMQRLAEPSPVLSVC